MKKFGVIVEPLLFKKQVGFEYWAQVRFEALYKAILTLK